MGKLLNFLFGLLLLSFTIFVCCGSYGVLVAIHQEVEKTRLLNDSQVIVIKE